MEDSYMRRVFEDTAQSCNFIHCFRNPGGNYEWADRDKSPPKYWVKMMAALFGYSDNSIDERRVRNPSQNILKD